MTAPDVRDPAQPERARDPRRARRAARRLAGHRSGGATRAGSAGAPWGLPEQRAAVSATAHADFQRYGASLLRSQALSPRVTTRIEAAVMGGQRSRSLQPLRVRHVRQPAARLSRGADPLRPRRRAAHRGGGRRCSGLIRLDGFADSARGPRSRDSAPGSVPTPDWAPRSRRRRRSARSCRSSGATASRASTPTDARGTHVVAAQRLQSLLTPRESALSCGAEAAGIHAPSPPSPPSRSSAPRARSRARSSRRSARASISCTSASPSSTSRASPSRA